MEWIELKEKFSDKNVLILAVSSLFTDISLYKEVEFDDLYKNALNHYFLDEMKLRCYCPYCKDVSIFKYNSSRSLAYTEDNDSTSYRVVFECASCEEHILSIFLSGIYAKDGKNFFCKIGQYPSLADLQLPLAQKYKSILKKYYKEFSKAIGLNAHGIGIGAFVYLRRIIELLLEEAHCEAKKQNEWDDEKFEKGKVLEQISLLKEYLPTILVENKTSYSILSKGIHELEEDECLRYFPVLKDMIELILDEKLAQRERLNKEQTIKKAMQEAASEIRSK